MDEGKKEAIKAQLKATIKEYARLACEDVMANVQTIMQTAAEQAAVVEADEKAELQALRTSYPEQTEILDKFAALIRDLNERHTLIIRERDAKIAAAVDLYFADTPSVPAHETSGAV